MHATLKTCPSKRFSSIRRLLKHLIFHIAASHIRAHFCSLCMKHLLSFQSISIPLFSGDPAHRATRGVHAGDDGRVRPQEHAARRLLPPRTLALPLQGEDICMLTGTSRFEERFLGDISDIGCTSGPAGSTHG